VESRARRAVECAVREAAAHKCVVLRIDERRGNEDIQFVPARGHLWIETNGSWLGNI